MVISLHHLVCVMEIRGIFCEVGVICLNNIYLNFRLQMFDAFNRKHCNAQHVRKTRSIGHMLYFCFSYGSQISVIPLNRFNELVFVLKTQCVFCGVETEF